MLAFLQELAYPSCAIIYLLEFNEYHEVETSICSSGSIAFIAIPGVIADSSRSEIVNKLLIYCKCGTIIKNHIIIIIIHLITEEAKYLYTFTD